MLETVLVLGSLLTDGNLRYGEQFIEPSETPAILAIGIML